MSDTNQPQHPPQPSNAEILGEVQRIGRTVTRMDIALRGSLETNELGLIAKHEMHEHAIVTLQRDHASLKAQVEEPAKDRRAMWRDAASGGIGGLIVMGAGAVWEWMKRGG